jgi:hypothetical protein
LKLRDSFETATMKFTQSIRFLLASSAALLAPTVVAIEDGEDICVQGFVIDNFCIAQRFFIDLPNVDPLVNPEQHTFHCMVDPAQCHNSGWRVLGAPSAEEGAIYTVDYAFDQAGNDEVLALMKTTGYAATDACVGCSGTDATILDGFNLGILATVMDAAAVPPVLSVRQLTYTGGTAESLYCATNPVVTTDAPAVATTDAPAVATTDAPAVATTDAPAVPTTDAPAVPTTGAPVAAPASGASSIKASLLLLVSWVAIF